MHGRARKLLLGRRAGMATRPASAHSHQPADSAMPLRCPPPALQPFEFTAGQPVSGPSGRSVESAGGLYAGGGIKPPPALSQGVVGMRVGGKRSVLVPAELGYGSRGEQEIPPNCDQFELQVRVGVVGVSELLLKLGQGCAMAWLQAVT